MENLRALIALSAEGENAIYHIRRKLTRMVMRTGGTRGDEYPAVVGGSLHPLHDGSLSESEVSRRVSRAVPHEHEVHCRPSDTGQMRIGCVWHIHTILEGGGDSKLLKHSTLYLFLPICFEIFNFGYQRFR